jgi:hypothetical protein
MKKTAGVVIAVALVLAMSGAAFARWGGPGAGCGPGFSGADVDVDKVRQFQKETLGARDELMIKKIELRNEYAKADPDTDRIKALRKEADDLQANIRSAADKYGMPDRGPGRMAGRGPWGRGMGPGAGYPCPQNQ